MSHPTMTSPHCFWLFGLSGAGKSTLAGQLSQELRQAGCPVLTLDGDALRAGLCRGLKFSDEDRAENLRRAAEAAKLGLDSGLHVVASFITPLETHRQLVAKILSPRLSFIHVDAPLEVCQSRDVKGLYAQAKTGRIAQMTGVTAPFESPSSCALRIDTSGASPAVSGAQLLAFALGLTQPKQSQAAERT